ncbi:DNA cytosine methyltransferase [Microbacterium sp. NPDC089189]|uniref:DNA cytosine methyltransferase n=1 Tax=Microbacterium sp. NPDC089189 TaxID=3154972 RepID=UPI00343A8FC1
MTALHAVDLLIGGGGLALGVSRAGFAISLGIDSDPLAVETVKLNRPDWHLLNRDVASVSAEEVMRSDLIVAGLPSPQAGGFDSGANDAMLSCIRLIAESQPRAALLEGTSSLLHERHKKLLLPILRILEAAGYQLDVRMLRASSFGVVQHRPRAYIVALKSDEFAQFEWPYPIKVQQTLGALLHDDMASRGWRGAESWAERANSTAPTIVGGSRRHGGADLGPTGTKQAWWRVGVDPTSIADLAPAPDDPVALYPRLTLSMVARMQGMGDWVFCGPKGAQFRLIASATPPPVAERLAGAIRDALKR